MNIEKLGNDLFRYGKIVQDDNTLTVEGWKRITIIKYSEKMYWVQMLKGEYKEIKEIQKTY